MWLLSTDRAELHYFTTPEAVKEGYAILSHCWGPKEQSFQEVREIAAKTSHGQNPRDRMDDKIRRCCELAESHGYMWVWIDTCCIDKSSSAELSESINSMFHYYALSSICYVYLHDSDATRSPQCIATISFQETRWITRGWTLQELIAPEIVVFINRRWELLGTKHDLADELERYAKVPSSLLRMEASIGSFSVAQRMSWASERETTRVEDQAYSLLGIFHVNMPTLYGEGARAFQRLQEEIMRRSPDTTLFAWGQMVDKRVPDQEYNASVIDRDFCRNRCYLFAESPRDFAECAAINHTPSRTMGNSLQSHSHVSSYPHRATFTLTPHGVLSELRLFVFDGKMPRYADLDWTITRPDSSCEEHVLLPLITMGHATDGTPTLHYPGVPINHFVLQFAPSEPFIYNLVYVTDDEYKKMLQENLQWQTVYLHTQPVNHSSGPTFSRSLRGASLFSPFRVSRSAVQQLIARFPGLSPCKRDRLYSPSPLALQHPGVEVIAFKFDPGLILTQFFELSLGLCGTPYPNPQPRCTHDVNSRSHGHPPLKHWARLRHYEGIVLWEPDHRHSCTEDHILTWVDKKKTFTFTITMEGKRRVDMTLCFSPCPMNPEGTLVLHFEVSVSRDIPSP